MATTPKIAFITGGNRGIGFETARQLGYYWLLINKQPIDAS